MKSNEEGSSRLWTQFMQLRMKPEKKKIRPSAVGVVGRSQRIHHERQKLNKQIKTKQT